MSTNERDLIVGGQAVIEGVMMRTPNAYAIAVRKADGTIVNTAARLPKWSDKYPLLKLPVLRGGAVLLQSMGLGIKALNYSANEAFTEVEEAKAAEVNIALTPAVIEEILDVSKGAVEAVKLRNPETNEALVLPVRGVFVAIGHEPNTKIFRNKLDMDANGYLIVKHGSLSNVPGVFVAGDVLDHRYRQAVTAAGSGCMAAMDAEKFLAEHKD